MAAEITIWKMGDSWGIWTSEEASKLREEYRICGSLAGSLPSHPLQNICFSLPLLLSTAEVSLLVGKGLAKVVEVSDTRNPSANEVHEFAESRKRLNQEQADARAEQMTSETFINQLSRKISTSHKHRKGSKNRHMEEDSEAERQREIQDEKKAEKRQRVDEILERRLLDIQSGKQQQESQQPFSQQQQHQLEKCSAVQIRTARSTTDLTRCRIVSNFDTLLYNSAVLNYFWKAGYSTTNGGKFGGNHLVYPGDPSRFHSFFVVVKVEEDEPLTANRLIRLGRLGSQVNKSVVLCSTGNQSNNAEDVRVVTLQWTKIN